MHSDDSDKSACRQGIPCHPQSARAFAHGANERLTSLIPSSQDNGALRHLRDSKTVL